MKQFEILSGRCLVVELPEGAHSPVVDDYLLGFNLPAPKWAGDWSDDSYDTIKLPPGNWHIVGMLSEVTDDDLINIIDVLVSSKSGKCLFPNFTGGPWKTNRIESLDSAILAEGYYLDENPHGEEPKPENTPNYAYSIDVRIWESAQSRVLDRGRCLLMGRDDL